MSKVAIIPARGGSKRIPRKNIRDFLGKPIIAYSIEAALKSDLFDEVMVSTDDEEIAHVAIRYGAKVPFIRSAKNADDFATTVDVLKEVLIAYQQQNRFFRLGCCIYPTAPFATANHLKEGLRELTTNNFDSVFPIVSFDYPIWRGLEIVDRKIKLIWSEYEKSRSQDLKKAYHDAGQWYWFKVDSLLNKNTVFTENSGAIELPGTIVQDIDNENDWQVASLKMKLFLSELNDGNGS